MRFSLKWVLAAATALLSFAALPVGAAVTVLGPGPVATPRIIYGGDYRIVPGTEMVAQNTFVHDNGQTIHGGDAIIAYSSEIDFEGGLIEGASITTQAGVLTAIGGNAYGTGNPANSSLNFYDGIYRGGSIIVNAPPPPNANFKGAAAIGIGGYQNITEIKIYGGLFEGGTVAMASSPDAPLSRGYALSLGGGYGGSLDVYGGTFVGGIAMASPMRYTIHGSDLNVQPPPVNNRIVEPAEFTVSGKYLDGSPFSINFRAFDDYDYGNGVLRVGQSDNSVTFAGGYAQVPEPTSWTLIGCVLGALAYRRGVRGERG